MQLSQLLEGVPGVREAGAPATAVRGLAYDSRAVEAGYLFAALRGQARDGNDYVEQAIERGAVAVLSSRPPAATRRPVAWVEVEDDRLALALVARNYYGRPDEAMTMVGVTGTNGKTTTCFLIEAALEAAGLKPCLVGTVLYRHRGDEVKADRTTPESLDLHRLLDRFRTEGARSCVMEVSSHALVLRRAAGVRFRAAVFTNLTQDHLDFHGTMDAYFQAKALLFTGLGPDAVAVLNADDPHGARLRRATPARVVTFGESAAADVRLARVEARGDGTDIRLECAAGVAPGAPRATLEIRSPLIGHPNASNLAGAAAACLALGVRRDAVVAGLGSVRGVTGRFERVEAGQPFLVIVDYAHTDDALARLLRSVRALTAGRVLTVFGCGGDRDRTKRPRMGAAAAAASDIVIVTSDNPRSESPIGIIEEILPGVRQALGAAAGAPLDPARCLVVPDRREAIRRALGLAREKDAVVIAGKGHETYQILGGRTIPFDDREVAREWLERLPGSPRLASGGPPAPGARPPAKTGPGA